MWSGCLDGQGGPGGPGGPGSPGGPGGPGGQGGQGCTCVVISQLEQYTY